MKTVGTSGDPNFERVCQAAQLLEPLRDELVFVGGSVVGLLLTRTRAGMIGATRDVDVVVKTVSAGEYHRIDRRLRNLGFVNDQRADAPICRYFCGPLIMDVMPTEPGVLGFSNRWYPAAFATAERVLLAETSYELLLVSAPSFVATKLEAHTSRGAADMSMSHDLEDVVSIIDGRAELADELIVAYPTVRNFVASSLAAFAESDEFLQALPGFFPPDRASQQRVPGVVATLRRISTLSELG